VAEIITVERRRRWSDEDKRRIVGETFARDASVSAVAKRRGLHPARLFGWRRALRDGALGRPVGPGLREFAPVVVRETVGEEPAAPAAESLKATRPSGRIEIILGRGRRVVVGADVDASALRRVLDAVERR